MRTEIEAALREGESLSEFVKAAALAAAGRRKARDAFLTRGRAALEQSQRSGEWYGADAVLDAMQDRLVQRVQGWLQGGWTDGRTDRRAARRRHDLAAHNGGWPWPGRSRCDSQPCFRIFRPVSQIEKLDPVGRFVRCDLLQQARLPDKLIHAPRLARPVDLAAADVVIGRAPPGAGGGPCRGVGEDVGAVRGGEGAGEVGWARQPSTLAHAIGGAMAQVTLYIDDATQARLREAAASRAVSQSQFVAELIRRATDDQWPDPVLALAGAVPDFPDAQALRTGAGTDLPRPPL